MAVNDLGARWERLAEDHLKRKGFKAVDRNYSWKTGEIDLVMKDGENCIVFVEVKKRTGIRHGRPIECITPRKMRRISRTAEHYIQKHRLHGKDFRFDAVEIIEWENGGLEFVHHQNIWIA